MEIIQNNNSGIHLFKGDNFVNWSRGVRLALGAKNKLASIDGSLSKPAANSDDCQKWIRNDYLVTSWILSSFNGVHLFREFHFH